MKLYLLIGLIILGGLMAAGQALAAAPASADLLWEANTYLPPFYRGHSQITPGSLVKVVAWPHFTASTGQAIPPEQLDFQWQKDGYNITSSSGRGHQVLVYTSGNTGANQITVTISTADHGQSLNQSLTLPIRSPQLTLYPVDPLLGTQYQQALGTNLSLGASETTLVAEPYFFSAAGAGASNLNYLWQLNNQGMVTDAGRPNQVTLVAPSAGSGENKLVLNLKNISNLFQTAAQTLTIQFNQLPNNF